MKARIHASVSKSCPVSHRTLSNVLLGNYENMADSCCLSETYYSSTSNFSIVLSHIMTIRDGFVDSGTIISTLLCLAGFEIDESVNDKVRKVLFTEKGHKEQF